MGLAVIAIALGLLIDSCMKIIDQKTDINLALVTNLLLFLIVFAYSLLVLEPARKWAEKHQRKK